MATAPFRRPGTTAAEQSKPTVTFQGRSSQTPKHPTCGTRVLSIQLSQHPQPMAYGIQSVRKPLRPGLVQSLEVKCRVRGASMDACVSIRHTGKPENPEFGRTETVNPSAARVEVEAAQGGSVGL